MDEKIYDLLKEIAGTLENVERLLVKLESNTDNVDFYIGDLSMIKSDVNNILTKLD